MSDKTLEQLVLGARATEPHLVVEIFSSCDSTIEKWELLQQLSNWMSEAIEILSNGKATVATNTLFNKGDHPLHNLIMEANKRYEDE